jgi:hypothetical protein
VIIEIREGKVEAKQNESKIIEVLIEENGRHKWFMYM